MDGGATPFEYRQQILGRDRPAEQIALRLRAALRPDLPELSFSLHALRGGRDAERIGEPCHRADDGDRIRLVGEIANERLIDLILSKGNLRR
jgi:hypothetical protein